MDCDEEKIPCWCPECGAVGYGIYPVEVGDRIKCNDCGTTWNKEEIVIRVPADDRNQSGNI